MGDLNGSVVYAQPIKTCVKYGLGGTNAAVRKEMHKYGQHLSDLWKSQNMEDKVQKASMHGLPPELILMTPATNWTA